MRITRQAVTALRTCAICERSLLVGERTVRYSADGEHFVDVCALCQDIALEHGWLKEGSPTTPMVNDRRRKRRGLVSALLGDSRKQTVEPVVDEPILRRLSEPELAMVEAADLFNESAFRRTIAGIAKSLGEPKASIVQLSGTSNEVVLSVAWDISWYQYRITPESAQPVRLAERGHDPRELEGMFTGWNSHLTPDGRIVPDISPL
jgi:cytochrome P450